MRLCARKTAVLFFLPRLSIGMLLLATGLLGCGGPGDLIADEDENRTLWRAQAEARCLAETPPVETPTLKAIGALDGPDDACGTKHAFSLSATPTGLVALTPEATLSCPMIPALDRFVETAVQPEAEAAFGSRVTSLQVAASYVCRGRNGRRGARISEHALANAVDISVFRLADGREITVTDGWNGAPEESAFLHAVHKRACETFTTVIGPDGDRHHQDHFHLDLARRSASGDGYRYCK